MDAGYDTLFEIITHKAMVNANIQSMVSNLLQRAALHDLSKLSTEEFDAFVSTRDRFKRTNYGTKEYAVLTEEIRPAIEHHYAHNRHHTGYHENGVTDMTLFDLLEMLADWKAASVRSPDLSFADSVTKAVEKYAIPPVLERIIRHTLKELEWTEK